MFNEEVRDHANGVLRIGQPLEGGAWEVRMTTVDEDGVVVDSLWSKSFVLHDEAWSEFLDPIDPL